MRASTVHPQKIYKNITVLKKYLQQVRVRLLILQKNRKNARIAFQFEKSKT